MLLWLESGAPIILSLTRAQTSGCACNDVLGPGLPNGVSFPGSEYLTRTAPLIM